MVNDLVDYEKMMVDIQQYIIRNEELYRIEPNNDLEKISNERKVKQLLKEYEETILEKESHNEIENFAKHIFEKEKDTIESGNRDVLCSSLEQLIKTYGNLKFNYYLIKVFRYFLEATMDHYYDSLIDPKIYNESNHL
jgi:hypothetical protein